MAHKELNSKEDFESAMATEGRYVFIYAYEGAIPPQATENAKRFERSTDAYSLDVGANPMPKEKLGITKVPTALVFWEGKEVARVDEMTPENMKGIEKRLMEL